MFIPLHSLRLDCLGLHLTTWDRLLLERNSDDHLFTGHSIHHYRDARIHALGERLTVQQQGILAFFVP